MKIVSWNMNKRKNGTWNYLINNINPDVALIQESSPISNNFDDFSYIEVDVKKNLKNTIYIKEKKYKNVELNDKIGMGLNCVNINKKNFSIYLLSVYGNLSFSPKLDFALGELLTHCINDLKKKFSANNIIIAGDFNMDRRMDDNPTGTKFSKKGERRCNNFFNEILKNGFIDCLKIKYPNFVRTHTNNRSPDFPWQIDHFFASTNLIDKFDDIRVIEDTETRKLSDHYPIVAKFNL